MSRALKALALVALVIVAWKLLTAASSTEVEYEA